MKEIINALIPAVSGVLGAIVGGWITSRAAIKRIDFDARQLRYQSKMNRTVRLSAGISNSF